MEVNLDCLGIMGGVFCFLPDKGQGVLIDLTSLQISHILKIHPIAEETKEEIILCPILPEGFRHIFKEDFELMGIEHLFRFGRGTEVEFSEWIVFWSNKSLIDGIIRAC